MNSKKIFIAFITWILVALFVFTLPGCSILHELVPELIPHQWEESSVVREATCQAEGIKEVKCVFCGKTQTESISLTDHSFSSEWLFDSQKHWHKCENCDEISQSAAHQIQSQNGKNMCSICLFEQVEAKGALSFHFMMLGNDKAGDCIYIKAGENDILIDGGSYYDSIDDITNYVNKYCDDNTLEYVILTHADEDHIACFGGAKNGESLFDKYEVSTIIDFPRTNKTTAVYNRYCAERQAEIDDGNSVHYTALECYNNENGAKRFFNLTEDGNIKMEILYNYYYDNKSDDENNYSVCIMFHHGNRQFLFTGDLEKEGEEKLAQKYDFTQVELFKLGHHGSYSSSNEVLLKEIKPKICVVTACAGSVQYTDFLDNTFPSQAVISRICKYTDKIYVPTTIEIEQVGVLKDGSPDYKNKGEHIILNGDIVVISESNKDVYVECSNNNKLIKDTDWFKEYRIWN